MSMKNRTKPALPETSSLWKRLFNYMNCQVCVLKTVTYIHTHMYKRVLNKQLVCVNKLIHLTITYCIAHKFDWGKL